MGFERLFSEDSEMNELRCLDLVMFFYRNFLILNSSCQIFDCQVSEVLLHLLSFDLEAIVSLHRVSVFICTVV